MLVSVYIPTKNRLNLLKRALNSVLMQDYKNIEIIVVNDASTDSTADWLAEMSTTHQNLRVIHHKQSIGAPASRNEAIKLASGHFITGLDDDDYFLAGRISSFIEYWKTLSQLNVTFSCLYSQDRFDDGNGRVLDTQKRSSVPFEELFQSNWIGNQIFTTKNNLMESGLFNENLPAWQDLEMLMRMVKKFGRAKLLDATTYYFDNTPREDRISSSSKSKILLAYKMVSRIHCVNNRSLKQKLYLQIFSPFYKLKPNPLDWLHFVSLGFSLKRYIQFAKTHLK